MTIFDVTQSNFQRDVLERSHQIPVVVDFWAPWCGPCRMLGPVLEKLANEPGSNFVLAKLNTDQNQPIAMQYDIRGIPAVKAFRNGQVVDEFVGAQPEPMVRQFLQRVTAGFQPQPQRRARKRPNGDPVAQARQLLRQGKGCEAQRLLDGVQTGVAPKLLPLARFMCSPARTGDGAVDGLLQQAASALQRRDHGTALYQLLAALRQAPAGEKQQLRPVMEGLFTLLGEDDPAVQQYRPLVAGV